MKTVTFKVRDETLREYLKQSENRSEEIRKALRSRYRELQADGIGDELTDVQRQGLELLWSESFELPEDDRDARKISKSVAESVVAQRLQIEMDSAIRVVIRPLLNQGYLRLDDRASSLVVFRERQPLENSKSREAADWAAPPKAGECERHKTDGDGFCWRCGEMVGESESSDESGSEWEMVACDGECHKMLRVSEDSSTRVCRECRAPEGQE